MGLSFFNAERAKQKAIEETLKTQQEEPTSPPVRGDEVELQEIKEVEPIETIKEEPIAIKKKKKAK